MPIAKQLKVNPRELANQVIEELRFFNLNIVERYEVAGPGFINIYLSDTELLSRANAIINGKLPIIPKSDPHRDRAAFPVSRRVLKFLKIIQKKPKTWKN